MADRPPGAGGRAVDVGRSRYICRLDPVREPVSNVRDSQPLRRQYLLLVLTLACWHHSFVLWTGFVGRTDQPAEQSCRHGGTQDERRSCAHGPSHI